MRAGRPRSQGRPRSSQSIDAPENLTAFSHFAVSDPITLPKSAGVPPIGMPPRSASRTFILGSASASLTDLLILSTILAGVPFGAPMPNHALASYPLTVSATTGTSGSASLRISVVTASARSLPDLMNSIEDGILSNIASTVPPIRSVSAGPEPRYGTWVILTPVIAMNNSPDRCTDVPLPDDAMLILPGLALP